ncbi:hypothetical protein, partial [Vibrio vulnificus]|uniref:hypothetical protein n=1 Tax=Vibrio vulnificus TaxID=672 RepID=UPI0019D42522
YGLEEHSKGKLSFSFKNVILVYSMGVNWNRINVRDMVGSRRGCEKNRSYGFKERGYERKE